MALIWHIIFQPNSIQTLRILPENMNRIIFGICINPVKMIFGLILKICLGVQTLTLLRKSLMVMSQIIYQREKVNVIALSIRWN